MDSFELNKILGAILGTLLFVMGLGFLAEAIYHPIEGRGPGYALASAAPAAEGGGEAAVVVADIGTLLASADPAAGEAAARKCTGCHNFAQGAGNKQGPELYGVVGRPEGAHPDFAYSDALLAHKANGDVWSYENLNAFLTSPKGYAPGTKMSFPGIKDDKERAGVIAYLATLSATPVPFPAPAAAAPAADAAPAATEAAPAATEAAPAATEAAPAATEAPAVETPTTTATETPVQGTPAPAETPVAPAP